VPEKAGGFKGSVQWDLRGARGTHTWHVRITDGRAVAGEGPADDARVKMRMTIPVFARVMARELDPPRAMMDGKLRVEGDFAVAAQIGPMFGEPERW
jgi:putative sterol carrier protein